MTEKHYHWKKTIVFHLNTDTENPGIDFTNPGSEVPSKMIRDPKTPGFGISGLEPLVSTF